MTEYSQKYWEVRSMFSPSQSCPFDPMTFTNESQLSHPRLAAIFKKCRATEHRTSLPPPEKKGEKGEVEKGRSTEGHGATLKIKQERGTQLPIPRIFSEERKQRNPITRICRREECCGSLPSNPRGLHEGKTAFQNKTKLVLLRSPDSHQSLQ